MEHFLEQLRPIQQRIPSLNCRVAPSTFDANDPNLLVIPRPLDAHWKSGETIFRDMSSSGVIVRVPLFWQMHAMAHAASRAVGIPLAIHDPNNIPVAAVAIERAGLNTVVSELGSAQSLLHYLTEKKRAFPTTYVVIFPIDAVRNLSDVRQLAVIENVACEVHLCPTVPLLVQCIALANERKPLFHVSELFRPPEGATVTYVRSSGSDALMISEIRLPFGLRVVGTCTCGEKIVTSEL